MPNDPIAILNASRNAALRYAAQTSVGPVQDLLKRAQEELNKRIKSIEGDPKSFTQTQLQATLRQVKAIADLTKQGLLGQVLTGTGVVATKSAESAVKYLQAADKRHRGVANILGINTAAVMNQAVSGTQASVLRRVMSDPNHPGRPGVMERYGEAVVGHFERTLQTSLVTGAPWNEVKAQLTEQSPFLHGAPAHWAERIVRTEYMGAHNQAGYQAVQEIDQQTGGNLIRILCATFDNRTGSDSYAVHGQIRRMSEPFESWFGSYMTPPNRPNDREIVVPHHMEWPLPDHLKPKSDGEVAARWHLENRKGSPPARPKLSTVPVDQIGKATTKKPTKPEVAPVPGAGVVQISEPLPGKQAGMTPDLLVDAMVRGDSMDLSMIGMKRNRDTFQRLVESLHPDIPVSLVHSEVQRAAQNVRSSTIAVEQVVIPQHDDPSYRELKALLNPTEEAKRARGAVTPTAIRMPDGRVIIASGANRAVADAIEAQITTPGIPGKQTIKLRVVDSSVVMDRWGLTPRVPVSGAVVKSLKKNSKALANPTKAPDALRRVLKTAGYTPNRIQQIEVGSDMDNHLRTLGAAGIAKWNGTIGIESRAWERHVTTMQQTIEGVAPKSHDLSGTATLFHEGIHGCSPAFSNAYQQGGVVLEEAFTEIQARGLLDATYGTNKLNSWGSAYQEYIDGLCDLIAERKGIQISTENRVDELRKRVGPELHKIAQEIWTGSAKFNSPVSYCRKFNELTGVGSDIEKAEELNAKLMKL